MRLVQGVGINDADYAVTVVLEHPSVLGQRKQERVWSCPFYYKWKDMLRRCYNIHLQNKYPTYKGCSVCEEWLTFSNFKSWMEQQDWEGKQLDKDLLVYQNKIYSPETCVFVDADVNTLLVKRQACRGDYPLGVRILHHKYSAGISLYGKTQYLGYFTSPIVAHREWQKAKIDYAQKLQQKQDNIRIKLGIQRVINKIQNDYDNNVETVDF